MKEFIPERAFIDPASLEYETGKRVLDFLEKFKVPISYTSRVKIEGDTPLEKYVESKRTIFLTLSKEKKFRPCSPSADFQFSLTRSCPGLCEYCYLQTTQGERPYIRIFANIEDIFHVIQKHIDDNDDKITTFECSSITDPIPFEAMTGSLRDTIEFFGKNKNGRLRFVTKYHMIDDLLDVPHNGHSTFRFSINTQKVIRDFEHNTSSMEERIRAAGKVCDAGYPIGFIVAPIMRYPHWKMEYQEMMSLLSRYVCKRDRVISFELIQHRYTETAKKLIYSRFPKTKLEMNDEKRKLKWGPYGKFKYVYKKEESEEIKLHMEDLINKYFPNGKVAYFT